MLTRHDGFFISSNINNGSQECHGQVELDKNPATVDGFPSQGLGYHLFKDSNDRTDDHKPYKYHVYIKKMSKNVSRAATLVCPSEIDSQCFLVYTMVHD